MIRVMIVEDEPPIVRAITACINQDARFTVAATAMTGQKALEQLRTTRIDVLFTDIRMPVMDGLTLIAHLRTEFPQLIPVILSGHQDFSYLQTAIRQQVADYLLKPVTRETLAPVLDRLAARVESGRGKDFHRAVENALFHEENLPPPPGLFAVGLFCAGPFPLVDDVLLPGRAFWEQSSAIQQWQSLCSGRTFCCSGRTGAEFITVTQTDSDTAPMRAFHTLWQSLNESAHIPVTGAVHPYAVSGDALGELHKNLRHTLRTGTRLFSPMLFEAPAHAAQLHPDALRRDFDKALCRRDACALTEALCAVIEGFTAAQATELQFLHFMEAVLGEHIDPLAPNAAQVKLELRATVSNAQKPESLAGDIAYLFLSLFEEQADTQEHEPALIGQIEQYLCENYSHSITTASLSEHFGFVPSYLSKLFRTHRGVSPSEYLTHHRILCARALIDANPEMLMKEVAQATGFSDQYYFSKIFKKELGILPTEYAANGKR